MIKFAAKILKINQLRKFNFCYLGSWLIFVWELGVISLGNLADFRLGTWQKLPLKAIRPKPPHLLAILLVFLPEVAAEAGFFGADLDEHDGDEDYEDDS